VNGGVRGELGPTLFQLGLLVKAREGDTATLVGGDALLQAGVGRSFSLKVLCSVWIVCWSIRVYSA
jgi:hypothetical protein